MSSGGRYGVTLVPCRWLTWYQKLSWWLFAVQSPRFAGLVRPYSAAQVVSKRGTIDITYPSNQQGKKLYKILKHKSANGEVSHTYGA